MLAPSPVRTRNVPRMEANRPVAATRMGSRKMEASKLELMSLTPTIPFRDSNCVCTEVLRAVSSSRNNAPEAASAMVAMMEPT